MGIETEEATKEDWLAAIDKVDQAVDSGQIRRITGQEYTEDLTERQRGGRRSAGPATPT